MRRMLGLLWLIALPVWADDAPSGCGRLCGSWVLDASRSEPAEAAIDAALDNYQDPAPPRPHNPRMEDYGLPADSASASAQSSRPERPARPVRTELRTQLLEQLTPPASLVVSANDDEVVLHPSAGPERHAFPGEPHTRVDAQGTATIHTKWKHQALVIDEHYGPRHDQTDTLVVLPDGTLQITREVERPGVKLLTLRSVYRRG